MSLQRELETFVAVDKQIQDDLHRKAQVENHRRHQEAEMARTSFEMDARRRADSFELERRRVHSRGVVESAAFVDRRVEPLGPPGIPAYDRYATRSANAYRPGSPVRDPLVGGPRVAWKGPGAPSLATA